MKITDPQVIRQGEKDLISSVQQDLDIEAVREILKERMSVAALSSKGGQIVVHNNAIAFRLDFEINLSGSLLFDREGNLIDEGARTQAFRQKDAPETDLEDPDLLDDDSGLDLDDADEGLSMGLEEEGLDEETDRDDPVSGMKDMGLDLDQELELAAGELALEDVGEDGLLDDDDVIDLEEEEGSGFDDDVMDDENPFEDDDLNEQDLDDDINDILKESREFWEQKKGS